MKQAAEPEASRVLPMQSEYLNSAVLIVRENVHIVDPRSIS